MFDSNRVRRLWPRVQRPPGVPRLRRSPRWHRGVSRRRRSWRSRARSPRQARRARLRRLRAGSVRRGVRRPRPRHAGDRRAGRRAGAASGAHRAALARLAAHPRVGGAPRLAIGHCFGGLAALELARSGAELRAAVSFHGGLATRAPARSGEVRARILACTEADDPFCPRDQRAAFEDEMTAAGPTGSTTSTRARSTASPCPGSIPRRTRTVRITRSPISARGAPCSGCSTKWRPDRAGAGAPDVGAGLG
jgi:hypothetical protein